MKLRSLVLEDPRIKRFVDAAILAGEPFTVAVWVKGDDVFDDLAFWKRILTGKERLELMGDGADYNGWRLLFYDNDPKRGRQTDKQRRQTQCY